MGTLKPQSNGSLYSNTVIGTLAVDGWAVTFGTAMRGLGGLGLIEQYIKTLLTRSISVKLSLNSTIFKGRLYTLIEVIAHKYIRLRTVAEYCSITRSSAVMLCVITYFKRLLKFTQGHLK